MLEGLSAALAKSAQDPDALVMSFVGRIESSDPDIGVEWLGHRFERLEG